MTKDSILFSETGQKPSKGKEETMNHQQNAEIAAAVNQAINALITAQAREENKKVQAYLANALNRLEKAYKIDVAGYGSVASMIAELEHQKSKFNELIGKAQNVLWKLERKEIKSNGVPVLAKINRNDLTIRELAQALHDLDARLASPIGSP